MNDDSGMWEVDTSGRTFLALLVAWFASLFVRREGR